MPFVLPQTTDVDIYRKWHIPLQLDVTVRTTGSEADTVRQHSGLWPLGSVPTHSPAHTRHPAPARQPLGGASDQPGICSTVYLNEYRCILQDILENTTDCSFQNRLVLVYYLINHLSSKFLGLYLIHKCSGFESIKFYLSTLFKCFGFTVAKPATTDDHLL